MLSIAWQHIQENKQIATLKYSKGSWTVKLRSHRHGWGAFFSSSWPRFAREASLHVGDVCVFELINREDACSKSTFPLVLVLHGPTSPQPPTALEKTRKFELKYPFMKLVM